MGEGGEEKMQGSMGKALQKAKEEKNRWMKRKEETDTKDKWKER